MHLARDQLGLTEHLFPVQRGNGWPFDSALYNEIERLIGRIKPFRTVLTRHANTDRMFSALVYRGASLRSPPHS